MVSLKVAAVAGLAAFAGLKRSAPQDVTSTGLQTRDQSSYVNIAGTLFNINGTTGYFAGTNCYWIGFLTNNADVDLVMTHLKSAGLKVLRVWGFNDITSSTGGVWYQSLIPGKTPVINTGSNGLQRLDYVVSSAESHGIKLIINFVNNWGDYGGRAAYTTRFGGDANAWYTTAAIQTQYRAYIKAVVSRYTTSPAIFSWELMNEPRCTGCGATVITNWATSVSAYIKSLDPNHLVTLGDEGFMNGGGDGSSLYTTGDGLDFQANLKIPNLDFGTFHAYPNSWGQSNDWVNSWITNHAKACLAAGKPCVLEEYGVPSNHVSIESPWQETALSLRSQGMAGDMFWQFGDTLSTGRTSDDGNTIFYGSSDWTGLVTNHVSEINKDLALTHTTIRPTTSSTRTSTTGPSTTSTTSSNLFSISTVSRTEITGPSTTAPSKTTKSIGKTTSKSSKTTAKPTSKTTGKTTGKTTSKTTSKTTARTTAETTSTTKPETTSSTTTSETTISSSTTTSSTGILGSTCMCACPCATPMMMAM